MDIIATPSSAMNSHLSVWTEAYVANSEISFILGLQVSAPAVLVFSKIIKNILPLNRYQVKGLNLLEKSQSVDTSALSVGSFFL